MKFFLIIIFVASLYLTPLYPVYAASASPEISNIKLEQFEKRLEQFKNKEKADQVRKINGDLADIKTKRLENDNLSISKLQSNLTSLENQANILATQGKNIDVVKSLIATARTNIQKAQQNLQTISATDYLIQINSENNVVSDVKLARKKLFEDLKRQQDLLITAKSSVLAAVAPVILMAKE